MIVIEVMCGWLCCFRKIIAANAQHSTRSRRTRIFTNYANIGVQRGGGDGPSPPPPLLGHFVKDFTKTVDFFKYSPPPQSRPPPF